MSIDLMPDRAGYNLWHWPCLSSAFSIAVVPPVLCCSKNRPMQETKLGGERLRRHHEYTPCMTRCVSQDMPHLPVIARSILRANINIIKSCNI